MQALREVMLSLMAMAALSSVTEAFGGDDGDSGGLRMITGLCAAACMLNALGTLFKSIV